MKPMTWIVACMVFALSTVALAGNAAADQATLDPLDLWTETYSVDEGDLLTVSWTSDYSLLFTVVGPEGSLLLSTTDTSYSDEFGAGASGSFVLTWVNLELSQNHLNYNVNVIPFDMLNEGLDFLWIILIIGAVALAAVVVIVLLVVLRRPHQAHQMQAPPQYQMQGYPPPQVTPPVAAMGAPGVMNCRNCSNPVDPQFAFCQRCGARLR